MSVPGEQAVQGLHKQAAFMQRKLENTYKNTYRFLLPWKYWIEVAENVLVWKKPLVAAFLYLLVHFIFIVFAGDSQSAVTKLGNLVFWLLVADILWRAATNQFSGGTRSERIGIHVQQVPKRQVSLEAALMRRSLPLRSGELPAFEVLCLWVAETLMWFHNLLVAMRFWSLHEPYLFFVCLFCPGLFLSLLGKYVPTLAVLYILAIGVLTLPYIEYHELRKKLRVYIDAHYPQALDHVKASWIKFKAFVLRDRTDFSEVSLHSGDERATQQALQDAFEHIASASNGTKASEVPLPPSTGTHHAPPRVPSTGVPGMSILQDSVLGLQPNAFLSLGDDDDSLGSSFSLGPGDMPSITDLDQSLTLPRFPSRGSEELTATSMPSIAEEDDILLPARSDSRDLDPFTDSLEYGGLDFTDSRPHNLASRSSRPLDRSANSNHHMLGFITEETYIPDPSQIGLTSPDTGYGSGYEGAFVPPPTYQSAVDGSDGAQTGWRDLHKEDQLTPEEDMTKGGYWLRHRR